MPVNKTGLQKIKNLTASELSDLYWNKKLSHSQIAKIFKISLTAFGLHTTIGKNNNINHRVILAIRKKEIQNFIENIRPFVIPSMSYKLRHKGTIQEFKREEYAYNNM